ncbi:sensor histidine kinase [Cryptosporangium japonicum]|uniref:sensor histidine kinase n=1 Tax=Cryptosporangium japonicum TaxID=80872 RepID=UPI0031DE8F8E
MRFPLPLIDGRPRSGAGRRFGGFGLVPRSDQAPSTHRWFGRQGPSAHSWFSPRSPSAPHWFSRQQPERDNATRRWFSGRDASARRWFGRPRPDEATATRRWFNTPPPEHDPAKPRSTWRTLGVDSALALTILALFAVAAGPVGPDPSRATTETAWWFLLPTFAILPVALRRVAPLPSVGLVCVSLLLTEWHADAVAATTVAGLVVTYTRAALAPVRRAVLATAALGFCGSAVGLVGPEPDAERWAATTFGVVALLACFFLGRTVFTRRAYTAALEERARVAELNREAAARQAVLDERRRIARELHDMVAHHVSVMGVLATGARRTLRRDPDSADEALKTIEDTGRASLREMRRLLDVLRTDDERAPDEPPPASGVAGLEQLAEQVREAGLDVELTVSGAAPQLDPGLDLTVFRVVQEALTNTLKHAAATHAVITVEFAVDGVRITVTDDGHGPAPGDDHLGHGLVGMRERVALYGGTLRTGARSGGGFRVYARLPLDGASRASA